MLVFENIPTRLFPDKKKKKKWKCVLKTQGNIIPGLLQLLQTKERSTDSRKINVKIKFNRYPNNIKTKYN